MKEQFLAEHGSRVVRVLLCKLLVGLVERFPCDSEREFAIFVHLVGHTKLLDAALQGVVLVKRAAVVGVLGPDIEGIKVDRIGCFYAKQSDHPVLGRLGFTEAVRVGDDIIDERLHLSRALKGCPGVQQLEGVDYPLGRQGAGL